MTVLHYVTASDGTRYPYEEGALDGLTAETRQQTAIALAEAQYAQGNTDYIVTRTDVQHALGRSA